MGKSTKKPSAEEVDRRNFLKSAAVGAAALVEPRGKELPPAMSPAAETGVPTAPSWPPNVDVLTVDRAGSDFMVDAIKSIGFEYIFANPGSSFRGLHESFITYGKNTAPEFLTC